MRTEIFKRQENLARLFAQAYKLESSDEIGLEVKAGFVSFLCLRTYAEFEISIIDILRDYVRQTQNDKHVAHFVDSQLQNRRRNLKHNELLGLVGSFSEDWKKDVRASTHGELRDSLDSLVSQRNKIAHGEATYISLKDLKKYFDDINRIIILVEEKCIELSGQD
ncbi:MAG: MAE_28990/MAE_18760 family HEPN-like nuclease [Chloroflexi bacterium]|nr:MAE_28990/MAE_18760 family HEPN-like nuclease [Chloroflexota bacterium]MCY3583649.1 MAE_28990/MAE_18760 family HEPN-like nuclease [Chloroflexota bacterium]MCY3715521.1 MAE_28990/MAE_18760 family HEPN-like nuclease [Chloroflexota bacterium]MDE2650254.1 MAE_28990/MAE_18760 family HEPN-like nuclease [Chloroflexota bacterium]MXX49939.1 hypothetical protein [Chloroflexota bacterium]